MTDEVFEDGVVSFSSVYYLPVLVVSLTFVTLDIKHQWTCLKSMVVRKLIGKFTQLDKPWDFSNGWSKFLFRIATCYIKDKAGLVFCVLVLNEIFL